MIYTVPEYYNQFQCLASACPAAATGTLFAIRYKKDSFYAAELFAVTTLLSIITLPVIMTFTQKIL